MLVFIWTIMANFQTWTMYISLVKSMLFSLTSKKSPKSESISRRVPFVIPFPYPLSALLWSIFPPSPSPPRGRGSGIDYLATGAHRRRKTRKLCRTEFWKEGWWRNCRPPAHSAQSTNRVAMADFWRTFYHEGGGCTPTPFHSIFLHVQSCSVRFSWEGRYAFCISSLPYMYSVATCKGYR